MIAHKVYKAIEDAGCQKDEVFLMVSSKFLKQVQNDCDFACGFDQQGNPTIFGIYAMLWEQLQEGFKFIDFPLEGRPPQYPKDKITPDLFLLDKGVRERDYYKVHEFCLDKITLLDGQAILTGTCSKMKGHEGAHEGKARIKAGLKTINTQNTEVEMVEY